MKYVCFDFDGTLADSFDFIFYSFDKFFYENLNIHMTMELFNRLSGPTEEGFLINEFKDKYDPKYWQEYLDLYRKEAHKMIKLFPGMKKMLEHLKSKGYNLIFLSGRSIETAMISLDDLKIKDDFIGYYGGSIEGCVKDKLLLQVSKDFNASPKDILYVGDSVQDIKDAKTAGVNIVSVLFTNPSWWSKIKEMNPNYATNAVELEKKIDEFMK